LLVTFSEFAALKGCAKGTVTAATKSRIAAAVVEKDGKRWLDRDVALELWNKNTKATHNAKVSQADPIEPPPATPRELRQRIDAIPDLNESRARREHYQAELNKLQVAQQRRELVPADEVKKDAFQIGRSIREALSNLADRLSHQLASETDPAVIHQLLSDEHRDALLALADSER
jgi:hypothetical protein